MKPVSSPRSCSDTSTAVVPFPALLAEVRDPYDALVPYSTYQLVASPPGSTRPPTMALLAPTDVAAPVTAAGAAAEAVETARRASAATAATAKVVRAMRPSLLPFR